MATHGKVPAALREFTRRPYHYSLMDAHLIEGVEGVAMYRQTKDGLPTPQFFEVMRLRWRNAHVVGDSEVAAGFRKPSSEDWGKYGWTFRTYSQAREKYEALCAELDQRVADAEASPDAESAD